MKDGINDYVVHGATEAVNPAGVGTKSAAHYALSVRGRRDALFCSCDSPTPGCSAPVRRGIRPHVRGSAFTKPTSSTSRSSPTISRRTRKQVMRQAFAGLLWSKQFYHYIIRDWLKGDPAQPAAAAGAPQRPQPRLDRTCTTPTSSRCRTSGSTPGTPAWDLAFHCIPLALVDPEFAKHQLVLHDCASGTCIPTASFPHTNGRSAT